MAPPPLKRDAFSLPRIRGDFWREYEGSFERHYGTGDSNSPNFFDVRFYPYPLTTKAQPIFAVIGNREVRILRPSTSGKAPVQDLKTLRDLDRVAEPNAEFLCTCTWAYVNPKTPLLCVSGEGGRIKVHDILADRLVATLKGHGGNVEDLRTHPLYPWIIASCSRDHSIRIWDLRRTEENDDYQCVIICGQGSGHREGILSISWHHTGRYIVSGGFDHAVCVWTLPDLGSMSPFWTSIAKSSRKRRTDYTHIIRFPHFISIQIHSHYVDCVMFYNDMILSKAVCDKNSKLGSATKDLENNIVLWQITGFDGSNPVPDSDTAPMTDESKETRNGFLPQQYRGSDMDLDNIDVGPPPYERLLTFSIPNAELIWMRFSLFPGLPQTLLNPLPNSHAVLAFCNSQSKILFWDLDRQMLGHDGRWPVSKHGLSSHDVPTVGTTTAGDATPESISDSVVPPGTFRLWRPATASLTQAQYDGSAASAAVGGIGAPNYTPPSRAMSTPNSNSSQTPSQTPSLPRLIPFLSLSDAASTSASSTTSSAGDGIPADRKRHPLHRPTVPISAHATLRVKNTHGEQLCGRAIAWSPCGRWCIVVGGVSRRAAGVENDVNDALGIVLGRWV